MRKRLLVHTCVLPLLALVAGASGCTGDDASLCSGPECATDPQARSGGVELNGGAPVALVQGGSVDLEITITRSGFDGPVNATASGLPAGVAATALVIPTGATSGRLSLSALPNVPQGTTSITVTAADADGKVRHDRA